MNVKKFRDALFKAGISNFIQKFSSSESQWSESYQSPSSTELENRKRSLQDILSEAQRALSTDLTNNDVKKTEVTLLGQKHNHVADYHAATKHAEYAGQNKTFLVLEANGEVHPNIDSVGLFKRGCGIDNSNVANVVTEYELYTEIDGKTQHELTIRINPCFKETERSLIIGMYVANLVAARPGNPITVIVGENHLKDIEVSIITFLKMTPSAGKVNCVCCPSTCIDKIEINKNYNSLLGSKNKLLEDTKMVIDDTEKNYNISRKDLEKMVLKKIQENPRITSNNLIEIINKMEEELEPRSLSKENKEMDVDSKEGESGKQNHGMEL